MKTARSRWYRTLSVAPARKNRTGQSTGTVGDAPGGKTSARGASFRTRPMTSRTRPKMRPKEWTAARARRTRPTAGTADACRSRPGRRENAGRPGPTRRRPGPTGNATARADPSPNRRSRRSTARPSPPGAAAVAGARAAPSSWRRGPPSSSGRSNWRPRGRPGHPRRDPDRPRRPPRGDACGRPWSAWQDGWPIGATARPSPCSR
mmetsp:Transcript_16946/g.33739  ORF Transcript_16946/g.33739 Transcript_16946/m.33739 type:complete len:206 (+) Transcript_16946:583-1200(+)